jgi:lipoprotein-anchoring transpeptidase ErfK/SrfK
MRLSRHFMLAVSLLGLMVLPANAQTSSESEGRELGAFALGAGTINPGSPETGPNAATSTPETNEKVESEPGTQPESGPAATRTLETDEKVESEPDTQPESNPSSVQAEPDATSANSEPPDDASQILINIDKSHQEMTVFVDGIEQYTWPVSTGGRGYATPSGNFTASSMNELWYSKQWDNAPMPNSIFFTKEGHAIHGSYETKKLGRAVSHGCVRLAPENAKTLYALVEEQGLENTKVVLTGVTPGGEAKVASQARSKNRNRQAGTAWYDPRDYYYPPRPQSRGFFGRRWFGGPYYDGPPPPGYPPRGYRRYAE